MRFYNDKALALRARGWRHECPMPDWDSPRWREDPRYEDTKWWLCRECGYDHQVARVAMSPR